MIWDYDYSHFNLSYLSHFRVELRILVSLGLVKAKKEVET